MGKIFAQLINDFVLTIPESAYIRFFILIFTTEFINCSSVCGVESAVAARDRYRKIIPVPDIFLVSVVVAFEDLYKAFLKLFPIPRAIGVGNRVAL